MQIFDHIRKFEEPAIFGPNLAILAIVVGDKH